MQRRAAISFDPNIRGFRQGQIYTTADNGAYYFAVRQDLDSMLSKIDPSSISDIIVIPGPYGVQYGPGFSFIDIVTLAPQRNANDYRLLFSTRANGGQIGGREIAEIGSGNLAFRISSGQRFGSNYRDGNGLTVPGRYRVVDEALEAAYYFNDERRLDFTYRRLDQGDTAFPASFFDITALVTDAWSVRYLDEDARSPWRRLSVSGWYNASRYNGNTENKADPNFPVIQRVDYAVDELFGEPEGTTEVFAYTHGSNQSTGARLAATFGEAAEYEAELTVGADYRRLHQGIREEFYTNIPGLEQFDTNLPSSHLNDVGIYSIGVLPWTERLRTTIGGRYDWVNATVDRATIIQPSFLDGFPLDQQEQLAAAYINTSFDVTDHLTFRMAFGHAERSPTLQERYSDQVFVGVLQSGFTRIFSQEELKKERNDQIDIGWETKHDNVRTRTNLYYARIYDYITYVAEGVALPAFLFDARSVSFTNTPKAVLGGFDVAADVDWTDYVTTFGTMRYTEGRDVSFDAPLGSIFPLDSTIGFRVHDADEGSRWGVETNVRIVDQQNRLGVFRTFFGIGVPAEESPTAGFTAVNLRGYYNVPVRGRRKLSLVGGIDNLFDKYYLTHLDVRLNPTTTASGTTFPLVAPFAPGITPYVSIDYRF